MLTNWFYYLLLYVRVPLVFFQFQAAAEANAAAIMSIPAEQTAGTSKEANKIAAARAEEDLFERAGLPQPTDPGPSDGQRQVASTEYSHLEPREILKLNTKWTRQNTGQLMGFRREFDGYRTVQQMHSATLHEILDTLADIKRQLKNWEDHGILPGELAANPDLNPLLGKLDMSKTHRFPLENFHISLLKFQRPTCPSTASSRSSNSWRTSAEPSLFRSTYAGTYPSAPAPSSWG